MYFFNSLDHQNVHDVNMHKHLPLQLSFSFERKKIYTLYNINKINAHFLKYYFNFQFVYVFDIFLTLKMKPRVRNM